MKNKAELIADNILFLLKDRNMKQNELAALVGVEPRQVNRWVRDRQMPSTKNLIRIAGAFGVSITSLTETDVSFGSQDGDHWGALKKNIDVLNNHSSMRKGFIQYLGVLGVQVNVIDETKLLLTWTEKSSSAKNRIIKRETTQNEFDQLVRNMRERVISELRIISE